MPHICGWHPAPDCSSAHRPLWRQETGREPLPLCLVRVDAGFATSTTGCWERSPGAGEATAVFCCPSPAWGACRGVQLGLCSPGRASAHDAEGSAPPAAIPAPRRRAGSFWDLACHCFRELGEIDIYFSVIL